jgi:hypothetical protein
MKRALLSITFALLGSGCSTWLNDTAPAPTQGYVYAVGARQKFFGNKATVWLCPTQGSSPNDCQLVQVKVRR